MTEGPSNPPLVIIALDGGDADLIRQWTREGYLPTIASIMQQGCYGSIGGPELLSPQGAWLSFFSGISRSEHGYYYNRRLIPGTYELQDCTVRDAHVLPFWSPCRGGSKTVATIDAFETEPLPDLSGFQLADWSIQRQFNRPNLSPLTEPSDLLSEVRRLVGPPIHVDVFRPGSSCEEDAAALHLLLQRIEAKGALSRHLLTRKRCDLTVIGFVESHTASHRLWDYRPGGSRETEAAKVGRHLAQGIREVYQAIDREIGLLLRHFPEQPNVFIVSLFGMKDLHPTTGLIDEFCCKLGYYIPAESSRIGVHPLRWLRQAISPDVRARMSRWLPRRLQARLEADRFQSSTDWSRTTAFSIPALNTSFLRVNLRGREPQGIVELGSEYERLLDRMEADLRQLVDVRSGKPAVERVIRTAKSFRSGPPAILPDLFVEWTSSPYFMDRVAHPKAELIQVEPYYNRSSYHSFGGFMAAAGPSIQAGVNLDEVSPLDFAPVFQCLLGEPVSQTLSMRNLNQCIRQAPRNSGANAVAV